MWLIALTLQVALANGPGDPFWFLQPTAVVSEKERRTLDSGQPIARVLPSAGQEVAVFAAVRVDVDGDRLVAWMREIEQLKASPYVLGIARFSDPPVIGDLERLSLDDEDLEKIRECRPMDCALKLSAAEMTRLQRAAGRSPDWKPAMQLEFRNVVLDRVRAYLARGSAGLAPYEDHEDLVWPTVRSSLLLGHSLFLSEHAPLFVQHLARYPETPLPGVESFVYWSKERLGGRPIVSATHVNILRPADAEMPDAIVAGKEIFATHYVNASLGTTALLRGAQGSYLVYVNRSETDIIHGMFGGLVRWFIERRLKSEAGEILKGLRARLESGEPKRAGVRP
jgi:hypothetical protein